MRRIVVIGGSAAGMMAAVTAADTDSDAEVTVVTKDRLPYRRPAIPARIAGYITEPADVEIFSAKTLNSHNIKLLRSAEATEIDTAMKEICILSGGKEQRLAYDAAVLATGGHPLIPKIPGADKKGVCTFTTYEEATELVQTAETADSAVVIGAGFIALEVAEALLHKGLGVYFNVRSRILRRLLEPDVSELLGRKFEQQGLKMLAGEAIGEIGGADNVEYVTHKGKRIPTNLVVMGAGVRPNVTLAEKCGIQLGASGAIKVNNRMQTSVADFYAAGDCAESPDLATGKFVYAPVGSIGALAGRIAGKNAAGGSEQTEGFLRAQADQTFGQQIFSIGHSTTSAKEIDLQVNVQNLEQTLPEVEKQKAKLFEAGKLLTDSADRIVGAQLVAEKHGSQFAWQLYKAVLNGQNRQEFSEQFVWPRAKVAQDLTEQARATVVLRRTHSGKTLGLVTGNTVKT